MSLGRTQADSGAQGRRGTGMLYGPWCREVSDNLVTVQQQDASYTPILVHLIVEFCTNWCF